FTVSRGVRHPGRVRRVYHGLEPPVTRALERAGQRIRAELGVGPDELLVGNVGRLALQKGQRHLIAAMPLLLERVPFAPVVVGCGRPPRSAATARRDCCSPRAILSRWPTPWRSWPTTQPSRGGSAKRAENACGSTFRSRRWSAIPSCSTAS